MVGARALQMMPGDILNSTGTRKAFCNWIHNRRWMNRPNVQAGKRLLLACQPVHPVCFSAVGGFALEWLRNTFRLTDEETPRRSIVGMRITWRGTGRLMHSRLYSASSRFGFTL